MNLKKSESRSAIETAMLACVVGSTLTYDDLARIGQCAREVARAIAARCIRPMTMRHGRVFEAIPGVGYMRVADMDAVARAKRHLRSSQRKGAFGVKTISTGVDIGNLTPQGVTDALTAQAKLGVISLVGSRRGNKAIARMIDTPRPLDHSQVLELFKKAR